MCVTKEEIKEISKEVFHDELFEFIPVLIAKGIKEADLHMKPAKETSDRLSRLEDMISKFDTTLEKIRISLEDNTSYHKDNDHFRDSIRPVLEEIGQMKPMLESIKKTSDARVTVIEWFKNAVLIVGGMGIIVGSIYGVKEWIVK